MITDQFEAACGGPAAIRAFAKAGGKFTDQQDRENRMSAAMYVAMTEGEAPFGGEAIRAFVEAGGSFTDQPDNWGTTAAMLIARAGADAINAFAEVGGKFTDQQDRFGDSAATVTAKRGAAAIKAYEDALAAQKKAQAPQQQTHMTVERPMRKAQDIRVALTQG